MFENCIKATAMTKESGKGKGKR